MLNILEAFFRRPWLHLLPLILMVVLGAVTAFSTGKEYKSTGTLVVSSTTPIEEITQESPGGGSFETPATLVARDINEQLSTDRFINTVAEQAGLADSPEALAIVRPEIRKFVTASADGDSLVRISATTDQQQLSFNLATATMEAYRASLLEKELSETEQASAFLQLQVDQAKTVLDAADLARDDFLTANPVADEADRPVQQQVRLDRLQVEVERAEARYTAAQDALAEAQFRADQAEIALEQRISVQDPPEEPGAPEPRLKGAVLTVILFGVLGVGLTLASVVISATLDRTVRLPNDVTGKFGLDVLAVVPDARSR